MEHHKQSSRDTQKSLLVSAAAVFAAKGYHEATIAEICEGAGANIASVNYYFRSKENLYVEAWRQGFEMMARQYPVDGGTSPDASAEERFAGIVRSLMRRFQSPENHPFVIIRHEISKPTGLLGEVMAQCLVPLHERMFEQVKELLGPNVPVARAVLCSRSVLAQCIHMFNRRPRISKQFASSVLFSVKPTVEELAEHVISFSLAGFAGIRRQAESAGEDFGECISE